MEEWNYKHGDLHGVAGDEEIVAHGSPAVFLQENHKESKTYENHHVDVLKHWVEALGSLCGFSFSAEVGLRVCAFTKLGTDGEQDDNEYLTQNESNFK